MTDSLIVHQQPSGCTSPTGPYPLVNPFYPLMSSPLFLVLQYHNHSVVSTFSPLAPLSLYSPGKIQALGIFNTSPALNLPWENGVRKDKSAAVLSGLTLNS